MSPMFNFSPSAIHVPSLMRTTSLSTIMVGAKLRPNAPDNDVGLVAWHAMLLNKWVVVDTSVQTMPFDCIITFKGDNLKPTGYAVHGYPAWVGNTYCLYIPPNSNFYIVMPKASLGHYQPVDDSPTIAFWVLSSGSPHTGSYTAKGQASGNETANINAWARWESDTQFGEYTGTGGASGTKIIGLPNWKVGNNNYTRSLGTTPPTRYDPYQGWIYGKYSYGDVYYDTSADAWVIGTVGDETGWWVGSEPAVGTSATYTFTVPEGSEVTGDNITLTWDKYIRGDNSSPARVGEAAIWRI